MDDNDENIKPESGKKKEFGIGISFALKGIFVFFKEGRNAKIHLIAAVVVFCLGLYLEFNRYEWLFIALAIALVFITEMINTSIELLCDLVMPYQNKNAGKLKDIAAGAVLISVAFALIVAGVIFYKYLPDSITNFF